MERTTRPVSLQLTVYRADRSGIGGRSVNSQLEDVVVLRIFNAIGHPERAVRDLGKKIHVVIRQAMVGRYRARAPG